MPDVTVEITPQPSIVAELVGGDQIAIDLFAGPPGLSGATTLTGTLTGMLANMDAVLTTGATWIVDLTNGSQRYRSTINAVRGASTANWSQSNVSVQGMSVPTFTLDVIPQGSGLALVGSGVGWSYRATRIET